MSYRSREDSVHNGAPVELYRFTQNASVWRYTSSDRIVEYLGEQYLPIPISRTKIDQSQEVRAGAIDVRVSRDNEIVGKYLIFNPGTPVWLTIYRFHREDGDFSIYFMGRVVAVNFVNSEATMKINPIYDLLQRKFPRPTYQAQCNHLLYDSFCGVSLEENTLSAQVSSIEDGVTLTSPVFATKPDGWLAFGYLWYGDEYRMIISHVGDTIELLAPAYTVKAGSIVNVCAGCARNSDTCKNKFNNLVNFLGFEFVPQKNPFDVGVS